jgi:heptosyltransferase-2/heptosyltransferase-3
LLERIAILKPCCIGDCVMALPAVGALAETFPGATLDIFAGRHSAAVFAGRHGVRGVRLMPDQLTARAVPALARRLRAGRYDRLVLLDRSRWLRLAAALSGSPWPLRVRDPETGFRHEGDLYLDTLAPLGIAGGEGVPRLQLRDKDRRVASVLLDELAPAFARAERMVEHGRGMASPLQGALRRGEAMPRPSEQSTAVGQSTMPPFAVLHPGGAVNPGASMLQKRWPAVRFTGLAEALQTRGLAVLLTGGPDEVELVEGIAAQVGLPAAANLAGRLSVMQAAALIEQAALYVGPDTGVSHLAAASGTPSVIIFGPTNPLRYGPRGPNVAILAPAASYAIADVDLRRAPDAARSVATAQVSLDEALAACDALLAPVGAK